MRRIWEEARAHAARTVNTAMVRANWLIGRQIVEAQQAGKSRAGYGEELLVSLSSALRAEYGGGSSLTGLKYIRAFFLAYPDLLSIGHAMRGESIRDCIPTKSAKGHALRDQSGPEADWKPGMLHPSLSWKTTRLTHGDLGQMLLYVHYYDEEVAGEGDNPTLGLILCTDKNDKVARFVLGKEDQNVFASRYRLQLPTEEQLRAELEREVASLTGGTTVPPAFRKNGRR